MAESPVIIIGNKDSYDRNIDYLRISITDRCNLRCRYCMPEGTHLDNHLDLLNFEEIERIVRVFAGQGIRKLKLTGGEPLARHNFIELFRKLSDVNEIKDITLTTNGVFLEQHLDAIKQTRINSINISLDTLDRQKFKQITGFDSLDKVLKSIDKAVKLGFKVKTNTAVMSGVNTDDIESLIDYSLSKNISARFIEMMPIGYGTDFEVYDNQNIIDFLKKKYKNVRIDDRIHGNGPAVYYEIDGYDSSVGLISATHNKFCSSCNRMRLTSTGTLKYCLCYENGIDLRDILRNNSDDKIDGLLEGAFQEALKDKKKEHCFEDKDKISEHKNMYQIGG